MSVYSINLPNDSPDGVFVLCDSTLPLKIDSPVSVAVIEEEEEDEDEDNSELKFYLARRKLMATMVVRNTVRNGKCCELPATYRGGGFKLHCNTTTKSCLQWGLSSCVEHNGRIH